MILNMWSVENSAMDQWLDPSIRNNSATAHTSEIEDETTELPESKVEHNNNKNTVKFEKVRISSCNNRLIY